VIEGEAPRAVIEEIAAILRSGGVVILPTDTIYGFHAAALDAAAVQKIFDIKDRSAAKALPILCANIEQLKAIGAMLDEDVEGFLAATWPAPLTAVVAIRDPIPASAGQKTIAARIPALDWLREVTQLTGPIASTSVNKSGSEPLYSTKKIPMEFESAVNAVVDAGDLAGKASTVVDFTLTPPTLIRTGHHPFTQILWKSMRKTL
ncbi:MAG TPA: L-threonylcarbamoyladenylate synthase, partial [Thermoanaerobaculia bacterium]